MVVFDLEMIVGRAERVGMNTQLVEGVKWAYNNGVERYKERHTVDGYGLAMHNNAAAAWGWIAAKQVITAYKKKAGI